MGISWVKLLMKDMSKLAAAAVPKGLMLVTKAATLLEVNFALDMFLKEKILIIGPA